MNPYYEPECSLFLRQTFILRNSYFLFLDDKMEYKGYYNRIKTLRIIVVNAIDE